MQQPRRICWGTGNVPSWSRSGSLTDRQAREHQAENGKKRFARCRENQRVAVALRAGTPFVGWQAHAMPTTSRALKWATRFRNGPPAGCNARDAQRRLLGPRRKSRTSARASESIPCAPEAHASKTSQRFLFKRSFLETELWLLWGRLFLPLPSLPSLKKKIVFCFGSERKRWCNCRACAERLQGGSRVCAGLAPNIY